MDEIIITARDVRAAGMCIIPGAKTFFKKHNLDFKDFIKNGISSDLLEKIDDAMSAKVIEVARGRK